MTQAESVEMRARALSAGSMLMMRVWGKICWSRHSEQRRCSSTKANAVNTGGQ